MKVNNHQLDGINSFASENSGDVCSLSGSEVAPVLQNNNPSEKLPASSRFSSPLLPNTRTEKLPTPVSRSASTATLALQNDLTDNVSASLSRSAMRVLPVLKNSNRSENRPVVNRAAYTPVL